MKGVEEKIFVVPMLSLGGCGAGEFTLDTKLSKGLQKPQVNLIILSIYGIQLWKCRGREATKTQLQNGSSSGPQKDSSHQQYGVLDIPEQGL